MKLTSFYPSIRIRGKCSKIFTGIEVFIENMMRIELEQVVWDRYVSDEHMYSYL